MYAVLPCNCILVGFYLSPPVVAAPPFSPVNAQPRGNLFTQARCQWLQGDTMVSISLPLTGQLLGFTCAVHQRNLIRLNNLTRYTAKYNEEVDQRM